MAQRRSTSGNGASFMDVIAIVRDEMRAGFADLKSDIAEVRRESTRDTRLVREELVKVSNRVKSFERDKDRLHWPRKLVIGLLAIVATAFAGGLAGRVLG